MTLENVEKITNFLPFWGNFGWCCSSYDYNLHTVVYNCWTASHRVIVYAYKHVLEPANTIIHQLLYMNVKKLQNSPIFGAISVGSHDYYGYK